MILTDIIKSLEFSFSYKYFPIFNRSYIWKFFARINNAKENEQGSNIKPSLLLIWHVITFRSTWVRVVKFLYYCVVFFYFINLFFFFIYIDYCFTFVLFLSLCVALYCIDLLRLTMYGFWILLLCLQAFLDIYSKLWNVKSSTMLQVFILLP